MKSKRTYQVALYGILLALIFVTMTLDRAISVFTPLSIAVITLTVTLSVCMLKNEWLLAVMSGVMFGFASWITSAFFPRFMDFLSPLISVLPRVFVGIVAFSVYKLMVLATNKMKNRFTAQYLALSLGSSFGVLTNTVCVLTCRNIFGFSDMGLATAFNAVLVTNFLPEIIIATILVPPTVLGVRKGLHLGVEAKPVIVEDKDIQSV